MFSLSLRASIARISNLSLRVSIACVAILILSACFGNADNIIKTSGDAAKNTGIGIAAARAGKGLANLAEAKIESQKTQQKQIKVQKQKTQIAGQILTSIASETLKINLAKQSLKSNEIIELEREKTKQIQAQNNGYSKIAIGFAIGVVFSILAVVLANIACRTSIRIGT